MRRTSSISAPYQSRSKCHLCSWLALVTIMPMTNATIIPTGESTVVIRIATPADRQDLSRLAALDSSRVPGGTLLLAQSDGAIRAAYSVDEHRAIADPFVA